MDNTDDTLKKMLPCLVLSKSLILLDYKNKKDIILAKNSLCTVSLELLYFVKFCMNRMDNIITTTEPNDYRIRTKYYNVVHGVNGFRFNDSNNNIQFYINGKWEEYSSSESDKNLLACFFLCKLERNQNEQRLFKIQQYSKFKNQYLDFYKKETE